MRAIIIDDEPDNVRLLALQLARHCPQVDVVGQFTDSTDGLRAIQTLRPGLVFLDIEMPLMNGFQLLERVGALTFHVVFVTAYDQYAVRAFRFSALDYLLKPIDTVDLTATVRRAENTARISPQQLELMQQYYPMRAPSGGSAGSPQPDSPRRIALPHANGLVFVDTKQIMYCEADSNYTKFQLENGDMYLVSKNARRCAGRVGNGRFRAGSPAVHGQLRPHSEISQRRRNLPAPEQWRQHSCSPTAERPPDGAVRVDLSRLTEQMPVNNPFADYVVTTLLILGLLPLR